MGVSFFGFWATHRFGGDQKAHDEEAVLAGMKWRSAELDAGLCSSFVVLTRLRHSTGAQQCNVSGDFDLSLAGHIERCAFGRGQTHRCKLLASIQLPSEQPVQTPLCGPHRRVDRQA